MPTTIPLALSLYRWATLVAPFPLTEAEWDQLLTILAAMRPGLVGPSKAEGAPEGAPSHLAPVIRGVRDR